MKKTLTIIGLAVATLAGAQAQVILTWNFGTSSANGNATSGTPVNFTVSAVTIGSSFGNVTTPIGNGSVSSGYVGASGNFNIGNAFRTGALDITPSTGSGYYQFTITPSPGFTFSLSGISYGARSTSTGPQSFALRSSEDSYGSTLFSSSISNNSTWTLVTPTGSTFTSSTAGTAVTFRLFAFGGTGSPGSGTVNGRIDDLSFTVTPIPEPAAWVLIGVGAGFMLWNVRRRRSQRA